MWEKELCEVLLSEARYSDNLPQFDSRNSQLKKLTITKNNCKVVY